MAAGTGGAVIAYNNSKRRGLRNNNPGNLKFEYAESADKTVTSKRTPEAALAAAQNRYSGVVALDQWGNAVFETEAAGRAAKAQLLSNTHGDKTIPEMLKGYAIDDYTGQANTDAYAHTPGPARRGRPGVGRSREPHHAGRDQRGAGGG